MKQKIVLCVVFLTLAGSGSGCHSGAASSAMAVTPAAQAPLSTDPKEALIQLADRGDANGVEQTIAQNKLSPNTKDSSGDSLLMIAAAKNRAITVSKLLELGADPALKNPQGKTALDFAKDTGNTELVQILSSAKHTHKSHSVEE